MRCCGVHRVILFALAALCADRRAVAQTSDQLFDRTILQEIRVVMAVRDLQRLHTRFDENTYYAADFHWQGLRLRNVAIRSRGAATRSATKPGFQIDFNRYSSRQQFLGLKSLVLDNLWLDPAMVRERVALALFERMGQPAPRVSFCRLYVNNIYYGVYGVVEAVTAELMLRTIGEGSGALFEYNYVEPFYGEYLGDALTPYKQRFEPRTHQLDPESKLYSPIRDLFREANGPDDAVWRDRVEEYLNLRHFVTHVAIETFLSDRDGILGSGGMANFYLYRSGNANRHIVIPWDKDDTFHEIDSSILTRADENVLFRRALAYPDLRDLYLEVLETCARSAIREGWFEQEVNRAASLIAPAAREDVLKPFSDQQFDDAVESLRQFARRRPFFVLREIARTRRATAP
jgi:spore coat protein CotH